MTRPKSVPGEKPLFWTGSSKDDLLTFPEAVIDEIGTALSVAQFGGKHPSAKPWRGEGPGVLDWKSTRLNSSHSQISYAVFCLKKKKKIPQATFPHLDCVPDCRLHSMTATT